MVSRTVYVSDMDGTLLRGDATLSDFARRSLRRLIEAGVQFTVATARSAASIRVILEGVHLPLPVAEFQGAMVTDLATGEHLHVASITPDRARAVVAEGAAAAPGAIPFVSVLHGDEQLLFHGREMNPAMAWYLDDRIRMRDPRLRAVDDVGGDLPGRAICLTFMGTREEMAPLAALLEDRHGQAVRVRLFHNDYAPGSWWITVHDRTAEKGPSVRLLLSGAGLARRPVVAFGDNEWDVSLFGAAGHGVAVGNATDELKAAADEVIGTNEEDAVVRFMLAAEGLDT